MEISGIGSVMPFSFQASERTAAIGSQQNLEDKVDLRGVQILADDEVEGVYNDTIGMIGSDAANALSMHGGLSESRVFALLGM